MGLSLEFYAGNAEEIGKAFCSFNLDKLRDGSLTVAYADFSLHLSPVDLDILSHEVAVILRCEPIYLLDSLVEAMCEESAEHGADKVAGEWVHMVARLADDQLEELAHNWIAGIAEEHKDPSVQVTPDAIRALEELVQLCRVAIQNNFDVVHSWYM
jgi:hypothetical protein